MNCTKLYFFAWSLLAALFLFLCTCATTTELTPQVSPLPPVYGASSHERGALVDALPLGVVSAAETAAYLNPTTLGLKIKPDLIIKSGFFDAVAALQPRFDLVRQIRLHYWSQDTSGRPIQLSGLLLVPALAPNTGKGVPLVLLCHGTQLLRDRVPSRLLGSERLVGLVAAGSGMAVVLPDYPGMGDSEGFHPYCLEASLAHAGVDALRAARTWIKTGSRGSLVEAPRTFVAGYSEGGYAAMASIKELQTMHPGEFPLEAAYPMAVPADMSGTMRAMMCGTDPVNNPYYLLYTLLGWRLRYPHVFDIDKMLKPEVVEHILPLMDGLHPALEVNLAIASLQDKAPEQMVAAWLLQDHALAALKSPELDPAGAAMLGALRENDLYDWPASPNVPLFLAASPTDTLVPPENSRIAAEHLKKQGATVTLQVLSPNTHSDAGIEAYALMLVDLWKRLGLYPEGNMEGTPGGQAGGAAVTPGTAGSQASAAN